MKSLHGFVARETATTGQLKEGSAEDRGLVIDENSDRTEDAQCTEPGCDFRVASFEKRCDALNLAADHSRETGHKVRIRIMSIVTISPKE